MENVGKTMTYTRITKDDYKREIREAYGHCSKCDDTDIWLFSYLRCRPYSEREMYGFHMSGYKKTPYVAAMCEYHMKETLGKKEYEILVEAAARKDEMMMERIECRRKMIKSLSQKGNKRTKIERYKYLLKHQPNDRDAPIWRAKLSRLIGESSSYTKGYDSTGNT